jgi:hypothetical protein
VLLNEKGFCKKKKKRFFLKIVPNMKSRDQDKPLEV